jgi:transposase-like protein
MNALRPLCPTCQTRTVLVRVTAGPVGFDIQTFKCPACNYDQTVADLLVDPMKSVRTNAWLRGQLHAPT